MTGVQTCALPIFSHNPAEHTDADDLMAGADVLLQVMLAVDRATLDGGVPS